jgi:hypothetical protein
LKEATPPDPPLRIPPGCSGEAPSKPVSQTGAAPAYLNGVYRWTITREEAAAAGSPNDPDYPATTTMWLKDGQYRASGDGTNYGTYWVSGNRITFHAEVYDSTNTFAFTRDSNGDLHLEPVLPMDRGDAVLMSAVPWTKIG